MAVVARARMVVSFMVSLLSDFACVTVAWWC
jgi:hypothetical protein